MSDKAGQSDVYLSPFPDLGQEILVSASGGTQPLWSRAGDELFYRGDGSVMAVNIDEASQSVASSPRRLLPDEYTRPDLLTHVVFDIAPEGDRFAMISDQAAPESLSGAARVEVVLNWVEELKERVPVD